jgi:hypothetical protein
LGNALGIIRNSCQVKLVTKNCSSNAITAIYQRLTGQSAVRVKVRTDDLAVRRGTHSGARITALASKNSCKLPSQANVLDPKMQEKQFVRDPVLKPAMGIGLIPRALQLAVVVDSHQVT